MRHALMAFPQRNFLMSWQRPKMSSIFGGKATLKPSLPSFLAKRKLGFKLSGKIEYIDKSINIGKLTIIESNDPNAEFKKNWIRALYILVFIFILSIFILAFMYFLKNPEKIISVLNPFFLLVNFKSG